MRHSRVYDACKVGHGSISLQMGKELEKETVSVDDDSWNEHKAQTFKPSREKRHLEGQCCTSGKPTLVVNCKWNTIKQEEREALKPVLRHSVRNEFVNKKFNSQTEEGLEAMVRSIYNSGALCAVELQRPTTLGPLQMWCFGAYHMEPRLEVAMSDRHAIAQEQLSHLSDSTTCTRVFLHFGLMKNVSVGSTFATGTRALLSLFLQNLNRLFRLTCVFFPASKLRVSSDEIAVASHGSVRGLCSAIRPNNEPLRASTDVETSVVGKRGGRLKTPSKLR